MQGASSTSDDEVLVSTIANVTGVHKGCILNFDVEVTSSGRRRKLLAAYTWSMAFEIQLG